MNLGELKTYISYTNEVVCPMSGWSNFLFSYSYMRHSILLQKHLSLLFRISYPILQRLYHFSETGFVFITVLRCFCSIPIAKSTLFEIPFRLGECESVKCMTSRIQHMEYLAAATYTYYALRRTMEVSLRQKLNCYKVINCRSAGSFCVAYTREGAVGAMCLLTVWNILTWNSVF